MVLRDLKYKRPFVSAGFQKRPLVYPALPVSKKLDQHESPTTVVKSQAPATTTPATHHTDATLHLDNEVANLQPRHVPAKPHANYPRKQTTHTRSPQTNEVTTNPATSPPRRTAISLPRRTARTFHARAARARVPATPQPTNVTVVGEARAVVAFASGLERVARYNDVSGYHELDGANPFQAEFAPEIDIGSYLLRLVEYLNQWFQANSQEITFTRSQGGDVVQSPALRCLMVALVYLDRICKHPESDLVLDSRSVHRLVFCAYFLAVKFTFDQHPSASWFASLGGVAVGELLALEARFCNAIAWKFYIDEAHYKRCSKRCVELCAM